MATLDNNDLGTTNNEQIPKSQPLFLLPAVGGGDTRNNTAVSFLGANRKIYLSGVKKFADQTAQDAWLRAIDGLIKPGTLSSVQYFSDMYVTPYMGQAYFNVLVESFQPYFLEGVESFVVYYDLEMTEAGGII